MRRTASDEFHLRNLSDAARVWQRCNARERIHTMKVSTIVAASNDSGAAAPEHAPTMKNIALCTTTTECGGKGISNKPGD